MHYSLLYNLTDLHWLYIVLYLCSASVTQYNMISDFYVQWNFSIRDTLDKGHLSNEDTVCLDVPTT